MTYRGGVSRGLNKLKTVGCLNSPFCTKVHTVSEYGITLQLSLTVSLPEINVQIVYKILKLFAACGEVMEAGQQYSVPTTEQTVTVTEEERQQIVDLGVTN